jgi:hypothetical protein
MTRPFNHSLCGINISDGGLEVDSVDQITISGDGASHLLTEIGETVEGLFNRFHGEVGVSAVDNLEESNLGVSGQVYILGTVSYKLNKSSTHCLCYLILNEKKIIIFVKEDLLVETFLK